LTRVAFSSHSVPSFFKELGLDSHNVGCYDGTWKANGPVIESINPTTGKPIASVQTATLQDYERVIQNAMKAKEEWAEKPAPVRGELIRQVGQELRKNLIPLGKLVSLEMGKIEAEGIGEVQEYIDVCDFATGLSRMLNGQVIPSERSEHIILEKWSPMGIVGVITAFNFPCAVYGWNAALALACGNAVVWKGSPTTPLTTIAVTKIMAQVFERNGYSGSLVSGLCGGADLGEAMSGDERVNLVSFTGSTPVGKKVATKVASRLGVYLLELGGNNATIVAEDADLDLAVRASVFGAVGTAGQRCTSLRRLYLHESIHDKFEQLVSAYKTLPIGDPLKAGTLVGPLHTHAAVKIYQDALKDATSQGGKILHGGRLLPQIGPNFVEPTLVSISGDAKVIQRESFVPILYLIKYSCFKDAIRQNNAVGQGLSSSLFTNKHQQVWKWLGPTGSDCGIVNVNIGTSGAEIGGAFGGNKETGWGRECGSDSWKAYVRRHTCTINYGSKLPLAQGINFG